MSQDEITSPTYGSPLRVHVSVSVNFLQVKVQRALERVYRVCKYNAFWQVNPRGRFSFEKEVCSPLVSSCIFTGELKGAYTACCLLVRS